MTRSTHPRRPEAITALFVPPFNHCEICNPELNAELAKSLSDAGQRSRSALEHRSCKREERGVHQMLALAMTPEGDWSMPEWESEPLYRLTAEHAKSGRAKCCVCSELIAKGEVRTAACPSAPLPMPTPDSRLSSPAWPRISDADLVALPALTVVPASRAGLLACDMRAGAAGQAEQRLARQLRLRLAVVPPQVRTT